MRNVPGNHYNKYDTRNPVARWLMGRFLKSFDEIVDRCRVTSALEVGCGEGHLSRRIASRGIAVSACDLSAEVIVTAEALSGFMAHPPTFVCGSIYDLASLSPAPLVVCCEVLEHLERPRDALAALQHVVAGHLIVSVPSEPLWRVLNMCRGAYIRDFGNTPGHLQHWSQAQIVDLVAEYFSVKEVRSVLPWTMIHAGRSGGRAQDDAAPNLGPTEAFAIR